MTLVLLLLAWLQPAMADCDGPPSRSSDINAAIRMGNDAFSEGDPEGFEVGVNDARLALGCLKNQIDTPTAAALHRLLGLYAFMLGEDHLSIVSFHAAAVLEPTVSLDSSIAPPGGPIDKKWVMGAAMPIPDLVPVENQDLIVYVDGFPQAGRRHDVPAIVQYMREDGSMAWSGVVAREEDLPTLGSVVPLVEAVPAVAYESVGAVQVAGSINPNKPLLASAGGTALVGGVFLAVGLAQRAAFERTVAECVNVGCQQSIDDFEAERSRVNTMGVIGQSSLGLAAGLGAASLIVRW